jgi:hypothetical protein
MRSKLVTRTIMKRHQILSNARSSRSTGTLDILLLKISLEPFAMQVADVTSYGGLRRR